MDVRRWSSERHGGQMLSSHRVRRREADANRWRGWARSLLGEVQKSWWIPGGVVLAKQVEMMVGMGCSSKSSWCTGETP